MILILNQSGFEDLSVWQKGGLEGYITQESFRILNNSKQVKFIGLLEEKRPIPENEDSERIIIQDSILNAINKDSVSTWHAPCYPPLPVDPS